MAKKQFRGVTDEQIRNPSMDFRDVRPVLTKFVDWLKIPQNMVTLIIVFAGVAFLYPAIADFMALLAVPFVFWALTRKEVVPLKMPIQEKVLDANQPHPSHGRPTPGKGIFFLGNDINTTKEIWLTNDDCRQHFLVLGTTGAGKSLPNTARVHTPNGWVTLGNIKMGDVVSTPDGSSAKVSGVFPQGELEICRITFEDGRTAEACPDHLWEVHHNNQDGNCNQNVFCEDVNKPRVLRTHEIDALLASNRGSLHIPLPKAVEKPEAKLSVSPYLMGALIGDGNLCGTSLRFSSADAEIVAAVAEALPCGLELYQDDGSNLFDFDIRTADDQTDCTNALTSALGEYGLLDRKAVDKFIPDIYKNGSIEQRWALIQGVMDAVDGSFDSRNGVLSFSTSSECLAKDLREVVWSLGGIAEISETQQIGYTPNGEKRRDVASWHLSIRHTDPSRFFAVPRKAQMAARLRLHADSLKLKITSVERDVRREEATCIRVEHQDHLFITENYVVTHNTETLLSFASNAISWGSGFLFCDGKGDVSLFAKVYAMSRRFGREDDLLVLNFMNGNEDVSAGGGKLRSNTMNPFSTGSSDGLTQMVVSLMDDVGGDGAMWKGRATAMLTGVMRALCWLRDQGMLDLNVGEIRDHMALRKIIELSDTKIYPDLPQPIRKSIRSYLSSLPGYQEDKKDKQAQTTLDQHGYLEMQFTKILGSLADVYGHIFATPYGEVDMHDVVLNRRILVIMLPALEKSGDEIANLGKIVVATLKGMMGGTLGSNIEGSWAEVVENRVTNSPSPFLCILDEVGYYTVEGMALMAAQARSLGFSMIYASQDIPAMKRLNEKEAASIIANTNTKVFMRTEEVTETGRLAVDTGHKATRVRTGGFERQVGATSVNFVEGQQANFEETDRVNFTDLKAQREGEMHIMFVDKVVRARGFYANPPETLDRAADKFKVTANHFVAVPKPSSEQVREGINGPIIMGKLSDPNFAATVLRPKKEEALANLEEAAAEGDDIAMAAYVFNELMTAKKKPLDAACAAVAQVTRVTQSSTETFINDVRSRATGDRGPMMEPDDMSPGRGGFDGAFERAVDGVRGPLDFDDFDMDGDKTPFGSTPPPSAPPRRPGTPPSHSLKNVNTKVPHGASVDGGAIINMADAISSNEAVMRSLASLDFDGDDTTPEEVETTIEEALGAVEEEATPSNKKDRKEAVRNFRSSASAVDFGTEEGEDEGGAGEPTEDWLESLLDVEDD